MAEMCKTNSGTMIAKRFEDTNIKGIDIGIMLGDGSGTFDILYSLEYDGNTIKMVKRDANIEKYGVEEVTT